MSFYAILIRFVRVVGRSWRDRETRGLVYLVVVLLLVGTLFYRQTEGWSTLDTLYFSVTTLTTVGYGDLHPSTAVSKVFTVIYIFLGIGITVLFVSTITERAVERRQGRKDRGATAPGSGDASDAGSREEDRLAKYVWRNDPGA